MEDALPRLRPVDTAVEDPTFLAYRRRLLSAVEARDTAALRRLTDPAIRTSFGNGGGWTDLVEKWRLPSRESELWNELATILRMGGSFGGPQSATRFCAPYLFSDWPGGIDAFEHVAVIDSNVPLRGRPSDDATIVASMDYEIVRSLDHDFDAAWRQVERRDKTRGWVRGEKVRSPIDYRACFQKTGGEWKMTLLVAGD